MPIAPTLFIVRHGRTQLNADGRLRGHRDIDLDSVGQLEAARLANVFAHVPLTRVVSRPLLRARQTAAPIAMVCDVSVESDDDLIDRASRSMLRAVGMADDDWGSRRLRSPIRGTK